MKKNLIKSVITVFILLNVVLSAQPYSGPLPGSVASGVIVNTGGMMLNYPKIPEYLRPPRNTIRPPQLPDIQNMTPASSKPITFIQDPLVNRTRDTYAGDTLLKSFIGLPDQGWYIPPDPYIAVNEYYMIATVNSRFRILNRDGANMYTQEADNWFSTLISNAGSFDPKVIYDHYAKRWVMVWLHAQTGSVTNANYMVSVSDDSIPAGNWYNFKLSSTVNGTNQSANWGDYQGVGYDDKNIYITSNQFNASGYFDYCRIRIVPKTGLYANNAGTVNWIDIWNIYEPNGNPVFGLRPVRMETPSDKFYFVSHSRYTTGTFFTVCELSNVSSSTPTMTVTNVPVGTYTNPANAAQLGNANLIDGGGLNLRNEPVYKDGKLYFAHSVAYGGASALRYLKIDANNKVTEEDLALSAAGYFHYYPALGVDKMGNVIITYTRSGSSEYAGAYYTVKEATSATLSGSKVLRAGAAPYYKTFGGTRNRWGDYNGAWIDPTDHNSVWLLSEYVSNTNTWGTWIGQIKVQSGGSGCKDIAVNSGWNIISVPVSATNMSPLGLFPSVASNIYGYENTYLVTDTLKTGKGYWAKFNNPQVFPTCGVLSTSNSISVNQGWNLIGGYDRPVLTGGITSNPPSIIASVFYGYNGTYTVADSLLSGKGYWVKASQAGTLNFPTGLYKNTGSVQSEFNELPNITITDAENRKSTLYFNTTKNQTDKFELPPLPPTGIFDIRFSSNKFVENPSEDLKVLLQSVVYPVTVSANSIDVKINGKELKSGDKISINKNSSGQFSVSVSEQPEVFALDQNYPNPFNPTTSISYQVPDNRFVSLKVYDLLGKEIAVLVNEEQNAGRYKVNFDGTNLSSGVYLYKLKSGSTEISRKMLLTK